MTKIRTWQLCHTGKFGQDGATITRQDIAELCETFTPTRPISIGHGMAEKDNFPKFGDVLSVERTDDGETLVGQVKLHPDLDRQYSDGLFSGWSVTIPRRAVDGKRYLHSLAVCGATPPKIPGLKELMTKCSYNDGDKVEAVSFNEKIEYEEDSPMTDEEKKKMEALEAENKKLKAEAEKNATDAEEEKKKKAEAEKASSQYADLQKELATLKANERKARLDGFSAKIDGKVPAGIKDKVCALAEKFADIEPCEFSDDKGNKSSVAALDAFADILCAGFKTDDGITKTVFDADSFNDKGEDEKETDWGKVAVKL